MNTDIFQFCEHNFQKEENKKKRKIIKQKEKQKDKSIDNIEALMAFSYIAGLMTCLLIYEVCKMMGLVGALV